MRDVRGDLSTTLKILQSNQRSIKSLAKLSGRDIFYFFINSNLSNLNLSNQDLTGLNFFGANLTNANLDGITYDIGAFNGAILSEKYYSFIDEFEFTVQDIINSIFNYIYVFVQFREDALDHAMSSLGVTNKKLASLSRINVSTLRKARRGEIVSHETAKNLADSLLEIEKRNFSKIDNNLELKLDFRHKRNTIILQPMIKILQFSNVGRFKSLYGKDIKFFIENKQIIIKRFGQSNGDLSFRFTPDVMRSVLEQSIYRNSE